MSDTDDAEVVLVEHGDAAASPPPPELIDEGTVPSKEESSSKESAPSVSTTSTGTSSTNVNEQENKKKKKESEKSKVKMEQEDDESEESILQRPRALQVVKIGNEADAYAFHFQQSHLDVIVKQIPAGWKVAVVSVVGAFRTGKSFLLSWFLRYLHHLQEQQKNMKDNVVILNKNDGEEEEEKWYHQFQSLGNDGFDWKAGAERNTTGIWMWSRPYFLQCPGQPYPMAVLVVDTQGMFDHETTMALTASIFGFSTLTASYQIYNVDKRIQEDHLQQLALFSEYARTAMTADDQDESSPSRRNLTESTSDDENAEGKKDKEGDAKEVSSKKKDLKKEPVKKPFQRIEFLVRDWQHFGDDDDDEDEDEDEHNNKHKKPNFAKMEAGMETYLQKVIAERSASDLQETREQINACFEKITCYGLPHPGFAVTKKKFTGDVASMEPEFLQLLDRFCQRVFNPATLQPKCIHGRMLTASEFAAYMSAYAALFASGAKFPTAATLLEATATANNTVATAHAVAFYKDRMDRVSGPECSNYLRVQELSEEHQWTVKMALESFDRIANFGSTKSVKSARDMLVQQLDESFRVYESLNASRNPLAGMETYLVSGVVALVSAVAGWITDATCPSYYRVCRTSSEFFSHMYAVVLCFLAILALTKVKQIQDLFQRVKAVINAMAPPSQQQQTASSQRPGMTRGGGSSFDSSKEKKD